MGPRAEGPLNRQRIFACRDDKKSSSRVQPPKILDQLDTTAATKRQPKCDRARLMFNKHFPTRWRIIRFTADSKAACRFDQCNQPRTDKRCMMDDEHLQFSPVLH